MQIENPMKVSMHGILGLRQQYHHHYRRRKKRNQPLQKLHTKYPDQVKITHENIDGSLLVYLPYNWLTIWPPKKVPAHISDNFKKHLG